MVDGMATGFGAPQTPLVRDLGACAPAEFRVRPNRVVVLLPGGQHRPSLWHRGEQCLVQALIPQASVEALNAGVLGGLPGSDVAPLHLLILRPAQDRGRGQLRAVVAHHRQGLFAPPWRRTATYRPPAPSIRA